MLIRNKEFYFKKDAYIMGILNVTPDSFSDGGKWNDVDRAVKHVEDMINEGASIIDIGAESTRPGFTPLSSEEELERVIPIIRKIRENFDIPISLDTYKANTLREVVKEGADILRPEAFAAFTMLTAIGWVELYSQQAARERSSSSVKLPSEMTCCSSKLPSVIVPVLSITTALSFPSASMETPPLKRIPFFEPAPIPEKNARGTLSTRAQGQLITRNVRAV